MEDALAALSALGAILSVSGAFFIVYGVINCVADRVLKE